MLAFKAMRLSRGEKASLLDIILTALVRQICRLNVVGPHHDSVMQLVRLIVLEFRNRDTKPPAELIILATVRLRHHQPAR